MTTQLNCGSARVSELYSRALADPAWTFATVSFLSSHVLELLIAARARLNELDVQNMANTTWAFLAA